MEHRKKKYIVTDRKRIWYSDTVDFNPSSGILALDDGRRVMVFGKLHVAEVGVPSDDPILAKIQATE